MTMSVGLSVGLSVSRSVYNEFSKVKTMIKECYIIVDQYNGEVYAILCIIQYYLWCIIMHDTKLCIMHYYA